MVYYVAKCVYIGGGEGGPQKLTPSLLLSLNFPSSIVFYSPKRGELSSNFGHEKGKPLPTLFPQLAIFHLWISTNVFKTKSATYLVLCIVLPEKYVSVFSIFVTKPNLIGLWVAKIWKEPNVRRLIKRTKVEKKTTGNLFSVKLKCGEIARKAGFQIWLHGGL